MLTTRGAPAQAVEGQNIFFTLCNGNNAGQLSRLKEGIWYALPVPYPSAFPVWPPPQKGLVRISDFLEVMVIWIYLHDLWPLPWPPFRLILHEQVFDTQAQGGTYIFRGTSSMTIQQYPATLTHGNGKTCPPVIVCGTFCCPLAVTAFHAVQTGKKFVDGQPASPPRILASAAA